MKRSIKIFGVLAVLAMLASLLAVATPASAQAPTLDATYYGITSTVRVTIFNPGWNTNPAAADTSPTLNPPVVVTNTAVGATTPTDTYDITSMTETGANTGSFFADVVLATDLAPIAAGDTIKATYGPNTATATVAAINFKKDAATAETWFDIGQSPIVEVVTASTSANADTVTVNVKSVTDATGISVVATETSATSGVYRGSFKLISSAITAAAGELRVNVYSGVGTGTDTVTATLGKSTAVAMTDDVPPQSNFTDPTVDLTSSITTLRGAAGDTNSGLAKVELSIDNGTTWMPVFLSTSYPATDTWNYAWVIPGDGSYNLKARAYDKVGNVETISATAVVLSLVAHVYVAGENWITVDVDSTAPVITNAAIDKSTLDAPMTPVVTATITDATSGVDPALVTVDASQIGAGGAITMTLKTGSTTEWTTAAGAIVVAAVPTGTKTLTITAKDKVGKTATATITVTVVRDTTVPTLSGAQVIYPTGGIAAETGHNVNIKVTATDDLTGIGLVQLLNEADANALLGIGAAVNLTRVGTTNVWQTGNLPVTAVLAADVTSKTYTVRLQAKDGTLVNSSAKLEATVTVVKTVTTKYYAFAEGFNNFSVPQGMTATSLADAFAGSDVTEIHTWVGNTVLSATKNADGTWTNPNKITIDPGEGYIVKAGSATSLTLTYAAASSTAPPVATITLYQGWNLFSPTFTSVADAAAGRDLGDLMSSAYGKWSVIYAYNTGTSSWDRITPDFPPSVRVNGTAGAYNLASGTAYWIYVTAPTLNLV